jgi:hypothetical protein
MKFNNLAAERFVTKAAGLGSFKDRIGTLTLLKTRLLKNTSSLSQDTRSPGDKSNLNQDCIQALGALLHLDIGKLSETPSIITQDSVFPVWATCVLSAAERFISSTDVFEPSKPTIRSKISSNTDLLSPGVISYVEPLVKDWSLMLNDRNGQAGSEEELLDSRSFDWSAYAKALSSVLSSMAPSEVTQYAGGILKRKGNFHHTSFNV